MANAAAAAAAGGGGLELDFFGMEKQNTNTCSSSPSPHPLNRRKSFRDIQGVISKLNPEVLKSVIGSGLPVDPSSNAAKSYIGKPESTSDTAPLTIFYNGTVSVFNVPIDKADNIFKLAERGFSKTAVTSTVTSWSNQPELPVPIDGGQTRRKSLQRFLAKRQERVTLPSPYICPNKDYSSQF